MLDSPSASTEAPLRPSDLPFSMSARYDVCALIICLSIGLLALGIGALRQVGNWGVESDFYSHYVKQAQNILSGKPYTYIHYPPGYAYLLAGLSYLISDLFSAAKMVSALSTALIGWLSYGLLATLFDRRLAFVSTVFLLLFLLKHAFLAATDTLANALLLLPLWIVFRRKGTAATYLMAGVAAGLAYLVRYNALFVLAGIPFALLVVNPDEEPQKERIRKAGTFLTAAFVTALPWFIANWHTNGSPFAGDIIHQIAAHFHHPQGDKYTWTIKEAGIQFPSLWDALLYDPSRVLRMFLKDVLHDRVLNLTLLGIGFPACLFAGAGLLLWLPRATKRQAAFVVVCALGYLLHGLAGYAERFYFFLFPLLFLFVVLGVFQVEKATGHNSTRLTKLAWLVVGLLLIESVYAAYVSTRWLRNNEPRYLLEVARLLEKQSSRDDAVMTIEGQIGYLTDRRLVNAKGPKTAEEYLLKARKQGVRYIMYSEFEESYWSGLKALSQPEQLPRDFRLVYQHDPGKVLIYEVLGSTNASLSGNPSRP